MEELKTEFKKRVFVFLVSLVVLVAVYFCAFWVKDFQSIMGNEGKLLESLVTFFFFIQFYKLYQAIRKKE